MIPSSPFLASVCNRPMASRAPRGSKHSAEPRNRRVGGGLPTFERSGHSRRMAGIGVTQQRASLASPGLQHHADVVEASRGADIAAEDGEVLVAGDVGDLAFVDAGDRGRVAGA